MIGASEQRRRMITFMQIFGHPDALLEKTDRMRRIIYEYKPPQEDAEISVQEEINGMLKWIEDFVGRPNSWKI